jgi:[protein-PII] uridylyltransferase
LQVLVYAPDKPGLFARITSFFDRMQFDVAAAKIYTTRHGWALDSFQVLTRTRGGEHYRDLIQTIEKGLAEKVAETSALGPPPSGRISRWVKHFPIEPNVQVLEDRHPGRCLVLLSCADRPGLLSAVARVMLKHELNLIDARVNTLGARAEDAFVVSGAQLADPAAREKIVEELRATAA